MYRHVSRPAALALLVALAAACGKDTPIDPATDNGRGTPIAIGQLRIASTADADTPWQDGDAILVSATPAGATTRADIPPLTAVYTYTGGSWTPNASGPLCVEHISPDLITIQSWGGDASPGADPDAYTNQSTADRYRRNDHLQCPAAKLTARTLDGELTHRRVDFVLNIADGANGALNALPDDAVLTLNAGNDGTGASQEAITAYRQSKTADGTTTFRALIKVKDVPGIRISGTGGSNSGSTTAPSGTVSDGRHLLGTLAYTIPASNGTRSNGAGSNGTLKTLKIYYSITSGTDANGSPIAPGSPVLIEEGKRITVSATFVDLSHLDATASLDPWTDIKAGDAGTGTALKKTTDTGNNGELVYEIYSAQGMKLFADLVNGTGVYAGNGNPDANGRLMKDINLSTVCSATKGNWVPIGTDDSNPYLGCFDGQGHTAYGLYIADRSDDCTGLFGCIGGRATTPTIQHLQVVAAKISSSADFTGVLAGRNIDGIITNCQAVGDDVTGTSYTGGLVGHNDTGGTITNCYATGNVEGTNTITGGLVGVNDGTITDCHATCNVTGTENTGGLVGFNNATITDCYATGKVEGTEYTGGLVGNNDNIGTITNCQAKGDVSGTSYTGGLVGINENDNGIITACQATGDVTGAQYTGGLVGSTSSTITACCATGSVKGTADYTGGLVGINIGTITAGYATGSVTGTNRTGGLVGSNDDTITSCYATGNVTGTISTSGLVGWNNNILQHCATTQSKIYGTNNGGTITDCESGRTSFSEIRATVAHDNAQKAWGSSIDTNGLVQSNENGRVLNGPWNTPPDASPTAIWKSPVDGPDPADKITGGSLHLWWQPNP